MKFVLKRAFQIKFVVEIRKISTFVSFSSMLGRICPTASHSAKTWFICSSRLLDCFVNVPFVNNFKIMNKLRKNQTICLHLAPLVSNAWLIYVDFRKCTMARSLILDKGVQLFFQFVVSRVCRVESSVNVDTYIAHLLNILKILNLNNENVETIKTCGGNTANRSNWYKKITNRTSRKMKRTTAKLGHQRTQNVTTQWM